MLLSANSLTPENVFCIGISSPGVFDENNGLQRVREQFKVWFEDDIVGRLKKSFGIPVIIKNDANMGAMGELLHGSGKEYDSIMGLRKGRSEAA